MEETGLIKGFNHKDFAENLSTQAIELVPSDISKEDKDFIHEIVFKFCLMAGEALNSDNSIKLNVNQATLITQFIGEWAFHKSIDLIRGQVDVGLREGILQKVAFTIFEIAKQGVLKNMPQEQLIPLVEHHVKKSFEEALNELVQKKVITDDFAKNVNEQSNIDEMAKAQTKNENAHGRMSDAKILKLASLAFLIKNLPKDKIGTILNKIGENEANVLNQYLNMDDLDKRLNPQVAVKCLKDMQKHLPTPLNVSYDRCFLEIKKLARRTEHEKMSEIVKDERPIIKELVDNVYENKVTELPSLVIDVISKHIEERIS